LKKSILPAAFTIACDSRITVYDALYLALAQTLDAELATLDTTLAAAASACGVKLAGDEKP
jgi:predicted nucleic acid-binding protein